jgi:hypothetical protein
MDRIARTWPPEAKERRSLARQQMPELAKGAPRLYKSRAHVPQAARGINRESGPTTMTSLEPTGTPELDPAAPPPGLGGAPWFGISRETAADVASTLRTQVVRELHRETWFVENTGPAAVETIPVERNGSRNIRRVQVNGEVAKFATDEDVVFVRPLRPLDSGAGTTVIVLYR